MFDNIDIERSLKNAQTSLLIMLLLTIFNVAGYFFTSGFYFPYSAIAPYVLTDIAFYYQLNVLYVVAAAIIAAYVAIGLVARSKPIWYIAAFILFTIDTIVLVAWLFLFLSFDIVYIMDIAFHIWVLVTLFKGSVAAYRQMIA